MTKVYKETDWSKLSDPVSTILERSDINHRDWNIEINKELEIPYFKGIFTEEMALEIVNYQYSKENKGYFSAKILDGVLMFKFLKRAF